MALHEFSITHAGEAMTVRVDRFEINPDDNEVLISYSVASTNIEGNPIWVPLQNYRPGARPTFEQSEVLAACATLGQTTIDGAADLRDYLNDLAEQLAKDKWAD